MKSIPDLLRQEGFVLVPPDTNVVYADKAFFAARVVKWIRDRASEPKFNLRAYLIALTYYRLGLAQLKFSETGDLLYRYVGVIDYEDFDEHSETDGGPLGSFSPPDQVSHFSGEEPERTPDD